MANLWFDGLEGLTAAYRNASGWTGMGSGSNNFNGASTSVPRSPGAQCAQNGGSGTTIAKYTLGFNTGAHVFAGVACLYPSAKSHTNCDYILYDGATAQVGWKVNADGSISVYRGANDAATLIGSTSAGVFAYGSTAADYHMVEMEVVWATGATGSAVLRVEGVQVLSVSSVQTSNTANAYCNVVAVSQPNNNTIALRFDDFFLNDDSGSAPENTFFGPAFCCVALTPSSDGTYDGSWTPSTGTNAAALVDDTGNDDTDYIASATANHKQSYNMTNVGQTGTVIGIHHHWIAKKDDVATREVAELLFINSTDYVGTTRSMSGSYQLFRERRLVSPDTSLRFTTTELDAMEAGVKVIT